MIYRKLRRTLAIGLISFGAIIIHDVHAGTCIFSYLKKVVSQKVKPRQADVPLPAKDIKPNRASLFEGLVVSGGPKTKKSQENSNWLNALKEENSETVFSIMKRRFQLMARTLAPLGDNARVSMTKANKEEILSLAKTIEEEASVTKLEMPPIYDVGRAINDNDRLGPLGGKGVYDIMPGVIDYLFGKTNEVPKYLNEYAPASIPTVKAARERFLPFKDKFSPEEYKRVRDKYLHILYNGLKTEPEFDKIGKFDPDTLLIYQKNTTVKNSVIDYVIPTGAYGKEFTEELILAGQTYGRIVDDGRGTLYKQLAEANPDMLKAEMARNHYAEGTGEITEGIRDATQEGILSIVQSAALLTKHKIPGVNDPKEALRIILETRPNGTSLLTEFTAKHMMGLVGPFNLSGRHFGPAIVKNSDGRYVLSSEFKTNISEINKSMLDKIHAKVAEYDNKRRPSSTEPLAKSHLGRCPLTMKSEDNGRQPLQDFVEGYHEVFKTITQ